ncbi:DUF4249 domain-containing protein [Carboxylicivirga marina]|uniref:DUF4249 domain-containing protein n=1 Tax=Carboxylicivirga marina TaxID=2800988 RepID=A0ABS1HPM7_9BACT|nr:DUF4249 domain-containing protein [Carboxylicivirga marina]MBK3519636.1 DUF4249 domain-containing protein [Carboxylicivirga marina]
MKRYIFHKAMFFLSLSALLGGLLQSCEEVIDIDLNDAAPKLVIDGQIVIGEPATVRISYTSDYFSDDEAAYEENASITITDSENNSENLSYIENGIYTGALLRGKPGLEYSLSITIDDKTHKGKSKILTPTQIVKLGYTEFDGFGGSQDEPEYNIVITLTNNTEEDNYYMVKYFINGSEKEDTYSLWSNEYFPNEETIEFTPLRFSFTKDDVVTVKAYSIDEGTYDYYSELDEIIDQQGGGSSTPFNPGSNFGKDVLGYFRAWSYDQQTVQVEDE